MSCSAMQAMLFAQQDESYRAFTGRLVPNVLPERMIGVRTPVLRSYARQFGKQPECAAFLAELPHKYYEENNLHGMVISMEKDFETVIALLDAFLPHVDNWATCDLIRPAVFRRERERLLPHIRRWMASDHTYTARFGLEMLMLHYLDDNFCPEYLDWAASVRGEDYYTRMMVAWYFATALVKQYDAALPYLQQAKLVRWTHNKTIQKAVESHCFTDIQKQYLRTLRRTED